MKAYYKFLCICLLGCLTSCSDDGTSTTTNSITTETAEQLENTALDAATISEDVIIPGSSKMPGTPPASNGGIDLDLSSTTQTAFLGEGFDITFSTTGNAIGAYIQFLSNDGVAADDYFDIDLMANATSKTQTSKFLSSNTGLSRTLTSKVSNTPINIDFGVNIPPGEFCYAICIYDVDGNVSEPQDVCVTVESWGGKDEMQGTWQMVWEEQTINGEVVVFETGQEGCAPYTFECADGQTLEASECYTRISGEVVIQGDGTYRAEFIGTDRWLDYVASYDNCEPVYTEEAFSDTSEGQWAYVSDNNRLTIVEYYYKEVIDGVVREETTYNPGDAQQVLDGTIVLNGDSFIITESRDEDGDGVEEIRKYYFNRI